MPWAGIKSQVKPLPEKHINFKAHQNLYMQYVQPGGNIQPKDTTFYDHTAHLSHIHLFHTYQL
jgi:hypothetical protein